MKRVIAFLALPSALLIGAVALLLARADRRPQAKPHELAAAAHAGPYDRRGGTFLATAPAFLPAETAALANADPPASPEPWETLQAAALTRAFAGDGRDATWSTSITSTLASALSAKASPGIQLSPVECRSSLCRVKVTGSNRDALASYVRETLVDANPPVWRGAWFLDLAEGTNPTAASAATVYLAREGRGLPQPLTEAP